MMHRLFGAIITRHLQSRMRVALATYDVERAVARILSEK